MGFVFAGASLAQTCTGTMNMFSNNTTADASQVNTNFTTLLTCANTYLAPINNAQLTGRASLGSSLGGWSGDQALSVQSSIYGNIISAYQAASGGTAFLGRVDHTIANLAAFYYTTSLVGSITTTGSATSYNTTSDYRLKTNVEPMKDGLARLMKLQPRKFNWKAALSDPKSDGFLAHELQAVVPGAVTGKKDEVNKDGSIKPQQVDYSKLVPLLVAAVQDQQAEIETLKAQVAALKAGH